MVSTSARQRTPKLDVERIEPAGEVTPEAAVEETVEPVRPIMPTIYSGGMSSDGYVPMGNIERVRCPLYPGLDLVVLFNTSIAYRFIREDYEAPGDTPLEKVCRKVAAFCAGFENWAFIDPIDHTPIPQPDPSNWESFKPLFAANGWLTDLGDWIKAPGLLLALNQTLGN